MVRFPETLKHAKMAACKGVTKITHKIKGWNKNTMISRFKGIFCSRSMSVFGVCKPLGKYRKSKSVIVCSILQAAM